MISESGRSPGEGNGNPLEYSCWRIPWTVACQAPLSMGSHRVGHDLVTEHSAAQSTLGKPKEPQVRVGGSRKTEVGSGKEREK